MMLYKLMLVLLIFSAVNAGLNSVALYSTKLPASGHAGVTQAQVVDLSNSMGRASTNPWTSLEIIGTSFRFIIDLALSLLTIAPLLVSLGVPLWVALIFSAPVSLVIVWGAYEVWTGHVTLPQE